MRKYRPTIDKPRSRVKKYREGGPVGEPAGDRIMLDEVDVSAPKFQPKGFFKGVRKRIADNIFPYTYRRPIQRVMSAVLGNNKELRYHMGLTTPEVNERYALFDIAMGQPVRDEAIGALTVSQYQPSQSSDSSAVYFRSPVTEEDIKTRMTHKRNLQPNPNPGGEVTDELSEGEPYLGTGALENRMYGGVLGNYTIGTGEDEKGKYISYYDQWDLDPFKGTKRDGWTGAAEELQSKIGITSPEIYGRLYYKENPDGSITYLD